MAQPFVSNQNTYLLHSAGSQIPTLSDDWLLGTADSFPLFSAGTSVLYRLAGELGLRITSYGTAVVALLGVYLLAEAARRHADLVGARTEGDRSEAAMATLLVATAHPVLWRIFDNPDISSFGGLGGQYMFSGSGFLQPSSAGCLVLLAIGIRAHGGGPISHATAAASAIALIALTCALHPGYLLAIVLGATAVSIAIIATTRDRRALAECALAIGAAMLTVAVSSPVARASLGQSNDSLTYLAFERIPHHTLWTNWSRMDVVIILVVLAGSVAARRLLGSWFVPIALATALALSTMAAVYVELARDAVIGVATPWRVSVFLVPIASTLIAQATSRRVFQTRSDLHPRAFVVLLGLVGGAGVGLGVQHTLDAQDPGSGAPVQLVREVRPSGVGLIPIGLSDIRLNAGFPIFVDWKSHPHALDDLHEWVRRVESVRSARSDDELCELIAQERLSWFLAREENRAPSCTAHWYEATDGGYVIRWVQPSSG